MLRETGFIQQITDPSEHRSRGSHGRLASGRGRDSQGLAAAGALDRLTGQVVGSGKGFSALAGCSNGHPLAPLVLVVSNAGFPLGNTMSQAGPHCA